MESIIIDNIYNENNKKNNKFISFNVKINGISKVFNINPALAFYSSCSNGYFDLVKHIHEQYTIIYNKYDNDYVFREICSLGNLEFAKWFVTKFPETDIHSYDSEPLYLACIYNHAKIVSWLFEKSPHFEEKIFIINNIFSHTCKHGHLEIIKLLVDRYPGIRKNVDIAFCQSCINGHVEIIEWFVQEKININVNTVRDAYFLAKKNNKKMIIKLLSKHYNYIKIY